MLQVRPVKSTCDCGISNPNLKGSEITDWVILMSLRVGLEAATLGDATYELSPQSVGDRIQPKDPTRRAVILTVLLDADATGEAAERVKLNSAGEETDTVDSIEGVMILKSEYQRGPQRRQWTDDPSPKTLNKLH